MDITVETVTPSLARDWLTKNPSNRPIKATHVKNIARDLKSGRWQLNGDAIRFNCDGTLIDGQHRLSACVLAETPFKSLIIRGLDMATRQTIDDGARRTHGDRLAMNGVKYATTVSAAIKLVDSLSRNSPADRQTPSELDALLEQHPGIYRSAAKAGNAKNVGSKGIVAAYHYIINRLFGEDLADEFLHVWTTCIPAYEGDPVQKFRTREMSLRASGRPMYRTEFHRLLGRAVDGFVIREPIDRLVMKKSPGVKGWTQKTMWGE